MAITRSQNKRNWSEMSNDLLVYIFALVNVLDRVTNVAVVCHSWRAAVSDKSLSNALDISECRQYAEVGDQKRIKAQLELAFVRGINLCGLNLTKLVFDGPFQVNNKHWLYASQRCPNLQELVLPILDHTIKPRFKRAFQLWTNLQSLHITFPSSFLDGSIFQDVGLHCSNLTVLKVSCYVLSRSHVNAIIKLIPGLKVLSLRCVTVQRYGLAKILLSMPNLEKFHVSLLQIYNCGFSTRDNAVPQFIEKARQQKRFSDLEVFHVCYWGECNTCVAATMGNPPLIFYEQ